MSYLPISKTLFAVLAASSTDATRYNLSSLRFDTEGGKLRIVATDGHMLAFLDTGIETPPEFAPFTMERSDVEYVSKLVKGKAALPVEMTFPDKSASDVEFKQGSTLMRFEKVTVDFPDYRKVIPEANAEQKTCEAVGFNVELMLRAMKLIKAAKPAHKNCASAWKFHEELSPCVLKTDVEDGLLTVVVMPLRLAI